MRTLADQAESNRQGICWIVSYPKSGNTWTRILLSNLIGAQEDGESPFQLNLVQGISSDRREFDNVVGLPSSDLSADEVDMYRSDLYRDVANNAGGLKFIKVHDGYHLDQTGAPIFPADCSFGAIYLVRNPLDVAVSFSHHQGHESFDRAVRQINSGSVDSKAWGNVQLRQQLLGWEQHYRTWHEQTQIPILTVSYEELLADTEDCLRRMALFAGLEEADDAEKVSRAVELSRFENLQRAEQAEGFREKPAKAQTFFRSGRSGEGREKLSDAQQQEIIDRNRSLMRQLNYL